MPSPLLSDLFGPDAVEYPDTDGELMAESDHQRDYLFYTVETLRLHYTDHDDVYASGNLLIYYEQGNPAAKVAPDCFVIFGVPKHNRRSYKIWEEGKGPDFVLEITSKSTRAEDLGPKRGTYAFLGVAEYWQYDSTGDYLKPRLKGYRLIDGEYREIPRPHPFGESFHLHSAVLGLELHLSNGRLRLRDPQTGRFLPTLAEAEAAYLKAEAARREAEAAQHEAEIKARLKTAQRQAAEARLAELEAELCRLRAVSPPN